MHSSGETEDVNFSPNSGERQTFEGRNWIFDFAISILYSSLRFYKTCGNIFQTTLFLCFINWIVWIFVWTPGLQADAWILTLLNCNFVKTSGVKLFRNKFLSSDILPNSDFLFSYAMNREGEPSWRIMCADKSVQNVCANIKLSFKLSRTELKMHDEHGEAKKSYFEASLVITGCGNLNILQINRQPGGEVP